MFAFSDDIDLSPTATDTRCPERSPHALVIHSIRLKPPP